MDRYQDHRKLKNHYPTRKYTLSRISPSVKLTKMPNFCIEIDKTSKEIQKEYYTIHCKLSSRNIKSTIL